MNDTEMVNLGCGRWSVNKIIEFERCLFFINRDIFNPLLDINLTLEMALAILALTL